VGVVLIDADEVGTALLDVDGTGVALTVGEDDGTMHVAFWHV